MKENSKVRVGGVFGFSLVRNGSVIDTWEEHNLVVDEGLNYLLDVALHGAAQQSNWYVGIYEGAYTPLATDTAANIAVNSTESTAYDEVARVAWVEGAAASKEITNSANKATFTINATKSIYGAFLVSESAKSDTGGVLFAAAKFGTSRDVLATDELLVTYTVGASS